MQSHTAMPSLLRHSAFALFWSARLAAMVAGQMFMVALGWHMYDLTRSAWDLGLVGLFQFVPALVLTLPAGHMVDRHRRSRIIAACFALQMLAALSLILADRGGWASRELILAVSVLLGVARAFQMPAQQALIALLVPQELLAKAVAFATGGMQVAVITGPALGGLLYAFGADVVYGCTGLLLVLAFAFMLGVKHTHSPSTEPVTFASMTAGAVFLWRHKLLLGATSLDLFAVLLGGATALLPMYARDILHTGPQGLGLLRAAPAAGALLMSAWLLRHPIKRRVGRCLLWSVAVFGLATLVFGWSENFLLSFLALAVSGAADNISVVLRQTLVQLETPDAIRGRVSAVNSIFIGASNQLGEFESGATAALLGPVGSVVLGGIGTLLIAAAWVPLFPPLAQRDGLEEKN